MTHESFLGPRMKWATEDEIPASSWAINPPEMILKLQPGCVQNRGKWSDTGSGQDCFKRFDQSRGRKNATPTPGHWAQTRPCTSVAP